MKSFLKYFWFPVSFIIFSVSISCYFIHKDYKLETEIYEKALLGDRNCVVILKNKDKIWKFHEWIIREAINGNQNALEILGITEEKE